MGVASHTPQSSGSYRLFAPSVTVFPETKMGKCSLVVFMVNR